jgi:phage FluMu protein Com
MSIEFGCCECRKLLRVPEASAGKKARCPACGSIQDVPSAPEPGSTQSSEQPNHEAESDSPFAASRTSRNPFSEGGTPASGNPFAADETNPYAAPTSGAGVVNPSPFGPGTEAWARTCVEGPANSLTAVAGIVLILSAIGMAINLSSLMVAGNFEDSVVSVVGTLVVAIPYGIVVYGALRMKQLQNYKLAIAVSILAMLPCSGCCILGLPVGIWSLVVLCNPTIRAAFR